MFFPEKIKNMCFGIFLQSIPGEEDLELSGIYGLLLVRAGPSGKFPGDKI